MSTPPPQVQFERWCSAERLGPYIRAAGTYNDAVALYEWNIAISGALHELLGAVEVMLRNTIHDRLRAWHSAAGRPGAWFDHPAAGLSAQAAADVAKARARLRAPETQGRIVAELPFGFWRFLLERRHQANLWPRMKPAFPGLPNADREQLRNSVLALHGLRNRVAHHEPIHQLDLAGRHRQLLDVAGYIDPVAKSWLHGLSRVEGLLEARPGGVWSDGADA